MDWRNRVVGHADVDPNDLLANPNNWRVHPGRQQKALEAAIDEVGFVSPVLVQQGTDVVVDGHLRVTLALRHGVESIPVTYLDLSDAEANLVLATIDPMAALAASDQQKYQDLMEVTPKPDSDELMALLAEMARPVGEGSDVPNEADGQSERSPVTCPACGHSF